MRPKIIITLLLSVFFMSVLTSYTFAYQRYRPSSVTGANRWERVSDEQVARDEEMAMDDETAMENGKECEIIDMRKSEEGNFMSDTLNFAGETVRGVTGNERIEDFTCAEADEKGKCPTPADAEADAVAADSEAACPVEELDDDDNGGGGLMGLLTAPFRYTYAAGEALLGGGAATCP